MYLTMSSVWMPSRCLITVSGPHYDEDLLPQSLLRGRDVGCGLRNKYLSTCILLLWWCFLANYMIYFRRRTCWTVTNADKSDRWWVWSVSDILDWEMRILLLKLEVKKTTKLNCRQFFHLFFSSKLTLRSIWAWYDVLLSTPCSTYDQSNLFTHYLRN